MASTFRSQHERCVLRMVRKWQVSVIFEKVLLVSFQLALWEGKMGEGGLECLSEEDTLDKPEHLHDSSMCWGGVLIFFRQWISETVDTDSVETVVLAIESQHAGNMGNQI